METLNQKDDGYRGIWYKNQPSHDEYVYKYSDGLGTYCAKHQPFAVYAPEVGRTLKFPQKKRQAQAAIGLPTVQ